MSPSSGSLAPRIPARVVDAAVARDRPTSGLWDTQWDAWMRAAPAGMDNGLPWWRLHARRMNGRILPGYWLALTTGRRLDRIPEEAQTAVLGSLMEAARRAFGESHTTLRDCLDRALHAWGAGDRPELLTVAWLATDQDTALLDLLLGYGGSALAPSAQPGVPLAHYALTRTIALPEHIWKSGTAQTALTADGRTALHCVFDGLASLRCGPTKHPSSTAQAWGKALKVIRLMAESSPLPWSHQDAAGRTVFDAWSAASDSPIPPTEATIAASWRPYWLTARAASEAARLDDVLPALSLVRSRLRL